MTPKTSGTRVLVVEDDAPTSRIIAEHLRSFGYEVCDIVDSVPSAIDAADRTFPELVLMDIGLAEGGDGLVAAKSILEKHAVPIVVVTARHDEASFARVLEVSPIGYLIKPFRPSELKVTLEMALHRHRAELQARKALTELALTDPITSLSNRRHLEHVIQSEWDRCAREKTSLAVMMIDIDDFKNINDNYGHAVGDACLKRAGALLNRVCGRGADTVGRWGGDEFLAILPGIDHDGLTFIAESIVRLMRESRGTANDPMTLSVGGALEFAPVPGQGWASLVEAADRRLYAAKACGRDRADCGRENLDAPKESKRPSTKTPWTFSVSPSLHDQLSVMQKQINRIASVVDQISCAIYEPVTGRLTTVIQATDDGGLLSSYSALLSQVPSLLHLVESRSPRVIHDIREETSRGIHHSQLLQLMQYRSSYTVPMFVQDDFIGFIFLDSHAPRAFTDDVLARIDMQVRMIRMLICQEVFAVRALHGTAHAVRHVAHYRDTETGSHLQRMARYAKVIAAELAAQQSLPDDFVDLTFLFAPFHDIGKLGISTAVLQKPDRLSAAEKTDMATHVDLGSRIVEMLIDEYGLGQFSGIRLLRNVVSAHHEFLDGSGYPRGLQGDQIPLEARIVTVADIFDALTSRRPYKDAWDANRAYATLRHMAADDKLDTACVAALEANHFSVQQITERFPGSLSPDANELGLRDALR